MLQALDLNRHHLDTFRLLEIGSVYPPGEDVAEEHRHCGLIWARRQKGAEDDVLLRLKGALETWALQVLGVLPVHQRLKREQLLPWEHAHKSTVVQVDGRTIGTVSVVPLELRTRIDEHLKPWSVAWAELRLDEIARARPRSQELQAVALYPQVDLDFSAVTDAQRDYVDVAHALGRFEHPLLVNITYVGSYEGKAIPAGKRSFTFRTRIGDADRTLIEDDVSAFRAAFEAHLADCGLELRTS
jgi:phenylalanyl-tRNA synthetase beta subunit